MFYTEAFKAAIERVLEFEGGYANNAADPGGETNFGISKRSYPDLDIAHLTRDEAIAIYFRDYWLAPRISGLPGTIAGAVLDVAISMGPKEAVILLQDAVTLCGHRVFADGKIGPQTIAGCNSVDAAKLIATYRWRVVSHYIDIATATRASQKFLSGWLRRACALV